MHERSRASECKKSEREKDVQRLEPWDRVLLVEREDVVVSAAQVPAPRARACVSARRGDCVASTQLDVQELEARVLRNDVWDTVELVVREIAGASIVNTTERDRCQPHDAE